MNIHKPDRPRFMESGGIYGRSTVYPWTARRIRRVFKTSIRLSLRRFTGNSANSNAFNRQTMHVLFAYEWRDPPITPDPPPSLKSYEPSIFEDATWREAA